MNSNALSVDSAPAAATALPTDSSNELPIRTNGTPSGLHKPHYEHLFSVPFMQYIWTDMAALNAELRTCILNRSASDPGVQATNAGGWHSDYGQLEFLGDLRKPLIERMQLLANSTTDQLLTERGIRGVPLNWAFCGWANVSPRGAFHAAHVHPGMTWSGVYYVDAGEAAEEEVSGLLRFYNPLAANSVAFLPRFMSTFYEIRPVAGLMVLFPSYLLHSVHPHFGNRERISIAFNFRNEPYP